MSHYITLSPRHITHKRRPRTTYRCPVSGGVLRAHTWALWKEVWGAHEKHRGCFRFAWLYLLVLSEYSNHECISTVYFFNIRGIWMVRLWSLFLLFDFHAAHRKNGIGNFSLQNQNVNLKIKSQHRVLGWLLSALHALTKHCSSRLHVSWNLQLGGKRFVFQSEKSKMRSHWLV